MKLSQPLYPLSSHRWCYHSPRFAKAWKIIKPWMSYGIGLCPVWNLNDSQLRVAFITLVERQGDSYCNGVYNTHPARSSNNDLMVFHRDTIGGTCLCCSLARGGRNGTQPAVAENARLRDESVRSMSRMMSSARTAGDRPDGQILERPLGPGRESSQAVCRPARHDTTPVWKRKSMAQSQVANTLANTLQYKREFVHFFSFRGKFKTIITDRKCQITLKIRKWFLYTHRI